MSDSESRFASVLSIVRRAKTDNEKFAALLIVSKQTKSAKLSTDQRNELLNTIGIQFPIRLVATANNGTSEDQSCNIAFASIGASILSLFCMDAKMLDEITKAVPHLINIAKYFSESEEGNQESEIVIDCLNCLQAATQNHDCASKMVEVDGIQALCAIKKQFRNQTIEIVVLLLKKMPHIMQDADLQNLIHTLSQNLGDDQSEEKFISCQLLFKIFNAATNAKLLNPHMKNVMNGLEDILCSKIMAKQRRPALMLASEVLRLFGISWFITNCKKEKFVVILTRLACIESGLYLSKDSSPTSDEDALHLLLACYSIAENFCSAIAKFEQNESEVNDVLTFDQIRLTQPALADLANIIHGYCKVQIDLQNSEPLSACKNLCLKSSLRFLGSWVNIENNLTSAQGIETISLFPKMLDYLLSNNDIDLIKTVLPGIMLATDNTEAFKTLLQCDILKSLERALSQVIINQQASSSDADITLLQLILQTIISVCSSLSSIDLVNHEDIIRKFFKTANTLAKKDLSKCTSAYVYTLISIVLNLLPDVGEYSKEDFVNLLDFLFNAIEVSKDNCLDLTSKYKKVWPDISSLWIMCGHEIADCYGTNNLITTWFNESKWSKHLTDFDQVSSLGDAGLTEVKSVLSNLVNASLR